jgi:hypothetical protein
MSDEPTKKPDFFTRPVLSVRDVALSVAYYCDKLGFTVAWSHGDPLAIAEISRPGVELILQNGTSVPSSRVPAVLALSLHDHLNLNDLWQDLAKRGAIIRATPFPVPWQEKVHQLEVEDLDGNLLLFWGDLPSGAMPS